MQVVGDTPALGPEVTDEINLGTKSSVTGGKSVSGEGEGWGIVCALFLSP